MCGCKQGECKGNCPCGCNHTSPTPERDDQSAAWESVRRAQVQVIVAASRHVLEAEHRVSMLHGEVAELERALKRAQERHDAATADLEAKTAKVDGFVRDYEHIGRPA